MYAPVRTRPRCEAIIPAHNEEKTVANTVAPVVRSKLFDRVTVVDDGSKDRTSQIARDAGATVNRLEKNRGKGGAMKIEVDAALGRGADIICFFDSDLLNLTEEHVSKILVPALDGRAVMVCGLRDYSFSPVANVIQMGFPPITGERSVRSSVIKRVPPHFWTGYRIEAGLNRAADLTGVTLMTILNGLRIVDKTDKVGHREGLFRHAKMFKEVFEAMRDAQEMIR